MDWQVRVVGWGHGRGLGYGYDGVEDRERERGRVGSVDKESVEVRAVAEVGLWMQDSKREVTRKGSEHMSKKEMVFRVLPDQVAMSFVKIYVMQKTA